MPRLIDHAGRFEFIRQAAFAVVLDEGVEALSRRRVAADLGTGVNTIRRSVAGWADLAQLAADHVRSRRLMGRRGRRSDDPVETAANIVRSLMPEDATHLDEELVWLKLVAACGLQPSGLQPPGHVRREFQVAQRGYDDGLPLEGSPENGTTAQWASRRSVLRPYLDERNAALARSVAVVLDLLEVPEPREDVSATLVAVVEGLTLSACLGRLTPEQATGLAVAHAFGLARVGG